MIIIKATQNSEAGVKPTRQLFKEMGNFNERLAKAGVLLEGEGLQPSSKGARIRISGAERMVSQGPFPEPHQLVAGFWIWRCRSLQEAIDWAKRSPHPMPGEDAEIEIRQLFEAEDFGPELASEMREQEERLRAEIQKR